MLVQPVRFAVVGVANTGVSFVAYALLVAAGEPYVAAALLGFALGALNGYVLNRRWTFEAHDSLRARLLYVLVQSGGAAATATLVWLAHDAGADRLLAYAVAIPPVTVATYLANRSWTFAADTAGRASCQRSARSSGCAGGARNRVRRHSLYHDRRHERQPEVGFHPLPVVRRRR